MLLYSFKGLLDAFNAGRMNSLLMAANPLPFESILTSNGSCLQSAGTNQPAFLSPPDSAIYWMHLSVDVPAYTQAHFYLVTNGYQHAIVKNHTSLPAGDTMIRDGVVIVPAGKSLTLASDYPTETTGVMQSYWAGFRLDNGFFNPVVVVSVACTSPIIISDVNVKVPIIYDRVLVNIGSAWSQAANLLTIPITGIYLFSYSTGVVRRADWYSVTVQLLVNEIMQADLFGGIHSDMTQDNTVDFISRTFLLPLSQGDNVTTQVCHSTAYSDTINLQIALHAVLYSPQVTSQVSMQIYKL